VRSSGSDPEDDLVTPGGPPLTSFGARRRPIGTGGARAVVISSVSTAVVLGAVVAVFFLAPGSKVVRQDFFNVAAMKRAFAGDPSHGIFSVGRAFLLNVEMFLVAEVLILALALVIAVVRQIPGPVFFPFRMVAVAYTDLFRGVPLLLVIYAMGYGIPALNLKVVSTQSAAVYGVAALVLSYSAYVSEVYRAGIESVHESQMAAARSLGLTRWQALRFVVLPQAIRRVIPPLLNDFVSLQKDTALVAVLGTVIEATRAAQIYSSSTFNYSSFVLAAFLFLLITIPLARFTDRLIARDRRRRQAGVGR
jgi:polar amino acid transport system permease protein